MNVSQIEHVVSQVAESQNDRLQAHFQACAGEWLAMPDLVRVVGAYAIHSRVAELRKRGMMIVNKRVREPGSRLCHSFYRYVPPHPSS